MSREDCENGKQSHWSEMEIRGPIKNLSPDLWTFTHLTCLYLNDNNLQVGWQLVLNAAHDYIAELMIKKV